MGGKKLGLHHGVDRGVARLHQHGAQKDEETPSTSSVVPATVVITGQVISAPPPKAISSIGLRPTLSEIQPNSGCASMKQNKGRGADLGRLVLGEGAVLVRNFCM